MDAWDYLVAVVREALQGLSRGMAGAAHGYRVSAAAHSVAADGGSWAGGQAPFSEDHGDLFLEPSKDDVCFRGDVFHDPAYAGLPGNMWTNEAQSATACTGVPANVAWPESGDMVPDRWTDPTYAYEPDNIYHGTLVDPSSSHGLETSRLGAEW